MKINIKINQIQFIKKDVINKYQYSIFTWIHFLNVNFTKI